VPEPELTLVLDAGGRVVGYACGNDMSSRSIEGENPLYLPQAKLYRDSCAVGPCLVPVEEALPVAELAVRLEVHRDGDVAFSGEVALTAMRRTPQDLAGWLFRASAFPVGVLLMTGTGIVPDESFTLADGDEVRVAVTGLGTLVNRVHTVS
jgi:2-dehydro-3-deoxy-D-arabinonate dehydratase